MSRIAKDDTHEVADSTDWLETPLKSLAAVDSALRCQVCKDFYSTPMITSCSHTFCSLCIRRSLNNDARCPACRAQDQEMKLRFNGAMESLVEAFKAARPEVLKFARRPEAAAESLPPKRTAQEAQLEEEDCWPRKRTTRQSSQRSSQRQRSQKAVEVLDSDDADDDYVPEPGYVLCPICDNEVKETTINAHIDRGCKDEPRKKVTTSTDNGSMKQAVSSSHFPPGTAAKRPERMANLNYSMVKDNALRQKLKALGLSAAGTRLLMEKRYREWVTLWNANCDATIPKTKRELKGELDVWERTQGSGSSTKGFGSQIKDENFDRQAWSNTQDDDFKQLIANARRKLPAKNLEDTVGSSSPSKMNPASEKMAPIDTGMGDEEAGEVKTMHEKPEKRGRGREGATKSNGLSTDITVEGSSHTASKNDKDLGTVLEMSTFAITPIHP